MGESILRDRLVPFGGGWFSDRPACRKGIGLIFPNQDVDVSGDTSEAGDGGAGSDKSFLFLLTVWAAPGIGLPGERGRPVWESGLILEPFGTLATSLENPAE